MLSLITTAICMNKQSLLKWEEEAAWEAETYLLLANARNHPLELELSSNVKYILLPRTCCAYLPRTTGWDLQMYVVMGHFCLYFKLSTEISISVAYLTMLTILANGEKG